MNRYHHLGYYAALTPDKPAVINATSGAVTTYAELDGGSNRLAWLLHGYGLRQGDHIAVLMENHPCLVEVVWAALRSGLFVTAVNRYLTGDEAAYVLNDCDARVVVSSHGMRDLAAQVTHRLPYCEQRLMVDGGIPGWECYERAVAAQPAESLPEQWLGAPMLYSSGTTGSPKGILRTLATRRLDDGPEPGRAMTLNRYGFDERSVGLTAAPLYHAASLGNVVNLQFCGGTAVFMEKFDAEQALAVIERHGVTHSQWVPTMFVRLLKLDDAVRVKYDLSSHRVAIHAAAPCPAEVKRQMIDWWGPIVHEYYSATEFNGYTSIDSREALERPGSVGRSTLGVIRICDDEGQVLPPGQDGVIYFERDQLPFRYYKDDAKTRAAQHPQHPTWTTVGDIGHVDADGYLYLTDRRDFMIISGGVNVYPQAIEDALSLHPKVADAAVIGVPDADLGEVVKAVVEPAPGVMPGEALAQELIAYLRDKVARYMVPRSVDFIDTMPRLPTGKLYKRQLRDRYRSAAAPAPTVVTVNASAAASAP